MFKNYVKIAWRNLIKNKVYSLINIAGLSIGMAVALLIGLWIYDELTFDHYHKNHEQLAQVVVTQTLNGATSTWTSIVEPLGGELRSRYGQDLQRVALASRSEAHIIGVGNKKIPTKGLWAEPDMPVMLSLEMITGTRGSFRDPSTLLLSRSAAVALFGDKDPLNKTVRVDNAYDLKVGGVYEDLPHNTTFYETNILLPWSNVDFQKNIPKGDWNNHICQLFVQIAPGTSFDGLSARIREILLPHIKDFKEYVQLHPMDQWHLYSEFRDGKVVGGRIQFVWLFGIIGIFVLLLACINFMNLSTARSEKRAREVGIRKTIGSLRGQLIGQFLCESLLVSLLSLLLGIVMVLLTLSFFNTMADKDMHIPWGQPLFWIMTLGFAVFTGLVSGSYPAFYLSHFEPIKVLKGTFKMSRLGSAPRKVLVVVQFTVSIALIIGTVIVFRQIRFAKDRPVGYDREGLITMPMNSEAIYRDYNAFRNSMLQTGVVADMGESNSSPTEVAWNNTGFEWKGKQPNWQPLFGTIAISHDFGHTVGWQIKEGRDFSRAFPTDSGAFILNESAVKLSGIKDPVGKIINWNGRDRVIVGVVKDMVMESPYKPVVPSVFHLEYSWVNLITVRIKPEVPMREALGKIEPVYLSFNNNNPFEYKFVDDEYSHKFSDEERIGNLATFFAILAIFISCLGLFGLASFIAEQRTKEIGVRKVLGASVYTLCRMLSIDFLLLVTISCMIAIPIAWYVLANWLQNYEYHTPISWWIFAASGIGALLIAFLTVSYQAIRAAHANPVKSLRME